MERAWLVEGCSRVAGSDEVGRGALGGPVSVGVVVLDSTTKRPPTGLRDSKLLTPASREALAPRIRRWASASAVGHASAAEIDELGILRALRLAGERALAALPGLPDLVLLDGNYDWYSRPERASGSPLTTSLRRVELAVKADLACASAAAASVLAKVERDALMRELSRAYPEYGWQENKGYATPWHLRALAEVGPSAEHRRSWRLPGSGTGSPVGSGGAAQGSGACEGRQRAMFKGPAPSAVTAAGGPAAR